MPGTAAGDSWCSGVCWVKNAGCFATETEKALLDLPGASSRCTREIPSLKLKVARKIRSVMQACS